MEYYMDQLMSQQQNHLGSDLWLLFHSNEGQSGKTEDKENSIQIFYPMDTLGQQESLPKHVASL